MRITRELIENNKKLLEQYRNELLLKLQNKEDYKYEYELVELKIEEYEHLMQEL